MSAGLRRFLPANLMGHYLRRRRARRLGIPFSRRRDFAWPVTIRGEHGELPIRFIDDHGARVDFLGILIDDMYMLDLLPADAVVETVVDIGANQGFFTLFARARFPGARIWAYEPNPALTEVLVANCRTATATPRLVAVGRAAGSVALELFSDTNLTRAHRVEDGDVPLIGFADVLAAAGGAIDLLKLDCEGWEWEILDDPGALASVRMLTMEYHLEGTSLDHADVPRFLASRGFGVLRQRRDSSFGQVLAIRDRPA